MKTWIASGLLVGLFSIVLLVAGDRPSLAADQSASDGSSQVKGAGRAGRRAEAGRAARRGALAGPSSRPAAADSTEGQARQPGQGLFRVVDRNQDGKLQPQEIGRFIDVLTKAQEGSKKADLTPEEWSKYLEELRPARGKGLRPGRAKNR